MRAVNLMPRDARREGLEMGRLPLFAGVAGVVVVTAVAFLLASSASGSADEANAARQAVESAIAQLPTDPDSDVSAGMLTAERSNRVAALAGALRSRTPFDRLLREISFVLPRDAWLTELEAMAPVASSPLDSAAPPPTVPADSGVTIQGATYSHDSVATVLARLSIVPSLADVRLTSTALVEPEVDSVEKKTKPMKPFVTFNIAASVRNGATP